jgi:acetyl-CoA carboxylase biotin carboxylase subunit
LQKILIANRGEIAVRVARACRDLGLASVAVYSEADRASLHVRMADEAVSIGASPPGESYLRIDRLLHAARVTGADAIHPGYGFLSENDAFARQCHDAGLTFIGPSPDAIALMGDKASARTMAASAGVPVIPGSNVPYAIDVPFDEVERTAAHVGYPLMVKAVAGGGGKGLRAVREPAELANAVTAARSEALSAFGDGSIYLERCLDRPRHVEVQVLGDTFGTILPFVERECSIQRRHQKVIEESPSPAVSGNTRVRLARAAVAVGAAVGYISAGTVEFLMEPSGDFYFLEMNTRLQVEHGVTEMVTGVDLVCWQIRIAAGERLDLSGDAMLTPKGHAIECRIYAEDPDAGFLPSPGTLASVRMPAGPGVRDDSGVETGSEISVHYDPLISKLVAWGNDRPHAIARMARAMREIEVAGVRTSVPFFRWILQQPEFLAGQFHTEYLDALLHERIGQPFLTAEPSHEEVAAIAAALLSAISVAATPTTASRWQDAGGPLAHANQQSTSDRSQVARTWTRTARWEGLGG